MRLAWSTRLAVFVLGSLSIGSLLLYFFGVAPFARTATALSAIEIAGLSVLFLRERGDVVNVVRSLLMNGIIAGAAATVAYDLVRVPMVHLRIPVFKAISYFGTVLLATDRPSIASEFAGWAYHAANGISFALMYVAIARRPRLWSAIVWGLLLEATMLITPYAEIFGYQRTPTFLAITLSAHVIYGITLYYGLLHAAPLRAQPPTRTIGAVAATVGLVLLIAADFNAVYATKLPNSPPPTVGPHLYTSWDVPEPDRICAMWVLKRFVDDQATFAFITPYDRLRWGTPFDIPESSVRREATTSATAALVRDKNLGADERLSKLSRMMTTVEVTPWMLTTDPAAEDFVQAIRTTAEHHCGNTLRPACVANLFSQMDNWYNAADAQRQ